MNVQPITPRDNAAYNHPQKQEVKQALLKIRIIADAIREARETGIASGVLYAMVMEKYSLNEYDKNREYESPKKSQERAGITHLKVPHRQFPD